MSMNQRSILYFLRLNISYRIDPRAGEKRFKDFLTMMIKKVQRGEYPAGRKELEEGEGWGGQFSSLKKGEISQGQDQCTSRKRGPGMNLLTCLKNYFFDSHRKENTLTQTTTITYIHWCLVIYFLRVCKCNFSSLVWEISDYNLAISN